MALTKLQLTKLDCAKRQLQTAIALYFHFGEPVSIHTLASAAYALLQNLNSSRGGEPMIKDVKLIKEEFRGEVRKKMNEYQNFFKHADKDPTGSIEFNPLVTECFIFESAIKYFQLTNEKITNLHIFTLWFSLWNPHIQIEANPSKLEVQDDMRTHNQ